MFNLGAGEVVVIALIALIILGPTRLPEAARTVGKVMGEVRRLSTGFQSEVRDAFNAEPGDGATSARKDHTRKDQARKETTPLQQAVEGLDAIEPAATTGAAGMAPEVADALDEVTLPAASASAHEASAGPAAGSGAETAPATSAGARGDASVNGPPASTPAPAPADPGAAAASGPGGPKASGTAADRDRTDDQGDSQRRAAS